MVFYWHSRPGWGEDGYFRIERGTDACRVESFIDTVLPKTDASFSAQNKEIEINTPDPESNGARGTFATIFPFMLTAGTVAATAVFV